MSTTQVAAKVPRESVELFLAFAKARGVTELLVETLSDQTPTYEWRASSLDNAMQLVIPSTSTGFVAGRIVVSVDLLEALIGAMAVVDVDVTISLSIQGEPDPVRRGVRVAGNSSSLLVYSDGAVREAP